MKKKQEIIIRCTNKEQFNKFIQNENKIICINVFDAYWGPCEVIDMMIKRYLDNAPNANKCEFISAEKEITGDLFKNLGVFTSKPRFFILHKGNIISQINGLDVPKLIEDIEKSFLLLDT